MRSNRDPRELSPKALECLERGLGRTAADWPSGPQAAALARAGLMFYAEHVDAWRKGGRLTMARGYATTRKGAERLRAQGIEVTDREIESLEQLNIRRARTSNRP